VGDSDPPSSEHHTTEPNGCCSSWEPWLSKAGLGHKRWIDLFPLARRSRRGGARRFTTVLSAERADDPAGNPFRPVWKRRLRFSDQGRVFTPKLNSLCALALGAESDRNRLSTKFTDGKGGATVNQKPLVAIAMNDIVAWMPTASKLARREPVLGATRGFLPARVLRRTMNGRKRRTMGNAIGGPGSASGTCSTKAGREGPVRCKVRDF